MQPNGGRWRTRCHQEHSLLPPEKTSTGRRRYADTQTKREASCSLGKRPSGVNWSTTSGNCWLSPFRRSSRDIPDKAATALIRSAPSALARSLGEIALFGPEPTQDWATSP